MAGKTQVGIELDGISATVVTMHEGTVADIATVTGTTSDDALARALASTSTGDPVRLVLAADGLVVRRVDVTPADLTHTAFADLAYRTTGATREGTTTAGLLFDEQGTRSGLLSGGVAAVSPADPVDRVYETLRARPLEVVPAPFTAAALEGISLALRHTNADLTLVVDGKPVAYRQLPAGGLGAVEAILGGGTSAGASRLTSALAGRRDADPIAVSALERYLRAVLTDVRDVLDEWARQGERTSREIYAHGVGATARSLGVLMSDAQLVRSEHPGISRALVHLAPSERASAVTAYLAAATLGHNLPYAAFVPQHKVRVLEAATLRRQRRRRQRVVGGAAALVLGATLAPIGVGIGATVAAHHRLSVARSAAAAEQSAHSGAWTLAMLHQDESSAAQGGRWATVAPAIVATAPSGVVLDQVQMAMSGADLSVTVTAHAADASTVDDYATAIAAKTAARNVIPETIAATPDGVSFTLTFTIPGAAS